MKKETSLKALGIGAMMLGLAANLFSSFVSDKKTDATIAKEVEKAVSKALSEKKDS